MSDLARVFDFDKTDLEYNRQLTFSPRQLKQYKMANQGCLSSSVMVTFVLVTLTASLVFLMVIDDMLTWLVPTVILGAASVVGVFSIVVSWTTRNTELVIGQIQGQAHLHKGYSEHGGEYCALNISGYEFMVDDDAYEVLDDGASYQVFFAIAPDEVSNPKSASKEIKSIVRL